MRRAVVSIFALLCGLTAARAEDFGSSEPRRLLELAVYGAWSPDGSTIAAATIEFDQECTDYHSLVLLDTDGTVRERLLPR